MNLNDLARVITITEGKKESLTIAQVKEVLNILGNIVKTMSDEELKDFIEKLKGVKTYSLEETINVKDSPDSTDIM